MCVDPCAGKVKAVTVEVEAVTGETCPSVDVPYCGSADMDDCIKTSAWVRSTAYTPCVIKICFIHQVTLT